MAGLKVVALISGGKDSLFSILHCTANGHEVIALANLHPPLRADEEPIEDTDSFMYQTIGHSIIPLYEKALGLPLYRQDIVGSAVNQDRNYGRAGTSVDAPDETESLVPLLLKVKEAHPEVNAVSTGAILSDYQRTRVESVAVRLGLTPLSYLWQWPSLPPYRESGLLNDMAAVGQDSRIVKVASGGLDDSFLWENVADQRTIGRLAKAAGRFGMPGDGAVLGEGGEYETLAVDGPPPLWKAKIIVDDSSRVVTPGEAGSFSVKIKSASVVSQGPPTASVHELRIPPLLDDATESILKVVSSAASTPDERTGQSSDPHSVDIVRAAPPANSGMSYLGLTGSGKTAAGQMRTIMNDLETKLKQAGMEMVNIVYTSIVLRDMTDFAEVNRVYGDFFVHPNPPARATLACASVLSNGCSIMLGATCVPNALLQARKGLHVQSRSYWAPANIGPYSQAIAVPIDLDSVREDSDLVYIAGQIPLEPASMQLSLGNSRDKMDQFQHQAVLALQHMTRIGKCMKVSSWIAAIAFVVPYAGDPAEKLAHTAFAAWHALYRSESAADTEVDHDDEFDVWDLTQRHGHRGRMPKQSDMATTVNNTILPPLWVVEVDTLPRNASVEWVGYGTTSEAQQHVEVEHLQYMLHLFRTRIVGSWKA
ncbi:hypothetical protein LTR56_015537 [Elasticomyces elasticus]|nr:hypothetical protein LTR56_015537 [Elasticomyces elasticus]KAK4916305.1 hypothetical protein LTR49_015677 [Elasticomyces elasticus]KAK5764935.1 hypothetical protein LTS12_004963 [Elasticomyces elasticus]